MTTTILLGLSFSRFMLSYEHFVREYGTAPSAAAAAAAAAAPATPTTLALAPPPRGAGVCGESLGGDVPRDWALAGTAAAHADTTAGADDRAGDKKEEERDADAARARDALVREWRALKRDAKRIEARRAAIELDFASLEGGDSRGSGARGAGGPYPARPQRAQPPWRCAAPKAARGGPRAPAPKETAANGERGARSAGDDDDDHDGPFALLLEGQLCFAHGGGGRDPPPPPREFQVVPSDDDAAPNGASSLGCGACATLSALP